MTRLERFALSLAVLAVLVAAMAMLTIAKAAAATPLPRSTAGSGTTNCGNKVTMKVGGANQYSYRVSATSLRPTTIKINGLKPVTCNGALSCTSTNTYAGLKAGENEITVTFADGTCGDAGLTTFIDK